MPVRSNGSRSEAPIALANVSFTGAVETRESEKLSVPLAPPKPPAWK